MWHPVAFADDLDDQPVAVRLLDEAIAIARIDGDVVAFKDLCIHRGTALSLGTVVDGGLQCAYHGWTFDSTGACVDMLHKIYLIRRGLSGHRPVEAMERLLFFLKKFPNNPQMLLEIKG